MSRSQRIYRTFHNVPNNANLTIHAFLLQLERWKERKGHYPQKIFWQIDGGSENANQFLLAICELLVAMNLGIEEILLTRLPVGHTHEGKYSFASPEDSIVS